MFPLWYATEKKYYDPSVHGFRMDCRRLKFLDQGSLISLFFICTTLEFDAENITALSRSFMGITIANTKACSKGVPNKVLTEEGVLAVTRKLFFLFVVEGFTSLKDNECPPRS